MRAWWGVHSPREILPLVLLAWLGTALGAGLLTTMSVVHFQLWVGLAVLLALASIGVAIILRAM